MPEIRAAFWNVQNLFDTTASDIAADLEFTPAEGWSQEVFDAKVANLAEIIRLMHGGQGPHLLGLCEVEEKSVVERLIAEVALPGYKVAHVNSPDIRGIDCSLVYSTEVFNDPSNGDVRSHLVHFRFPTRDIFQVRLTLKANDAELNVFVNHWPSRSQGQFESEPHRMTVGERCGQLVDEVLKVGRGEFAKVPDSPEGLGMLNALWNRNVLLMGDFNDEPFNRSITDYLKASKDLDKVEEELKPGKGREIPTLKNYLAATPVLFNLSWAQLGTPDTGTYFFGGGQSNTMNLLDQWMVSRGLYFGASKLRVRPGSAQIFRPPKMTTSGKHRPKGFDRTTKKGFSDHFPIELTIDTV